MAGASKGMDGAAAGFRYRAFISYRHKDKAWGDWLHRALESYRVPRELVGKADRDGTIPARVAPVFRDREDLAASVDLGTEIRNALAASANLVVICSPGAVASKFVADEIIEFAELEESIDTPVRYYSSGMISRLAFSVAAHLDTDVLLVDEVLAVGDVGFQRKCVTRILSYLEGGGALVFVSHNIPQTQAVCQRGLLLEEGRVTHAGPVVDTVAAYLTHQAELARIHPTSSDSPPTPVEITDVRIVNPAGDRLRSGMPARIEVDYRSPQPYLAVWGFSFWTGDHWICITGDYDMRPRTLDAEGTMVATIPRLPLIGGARPFRDCEFGFVHPKAINGVLLEVIDYKWRELDGK